jgi:hypothetical protein
MLNGFLRKRLKYADALTFTPSFNGPFHFLKAKK